VQTIELKIPCENGFEKVAMNTAADCARMIGMTDDRIEDVKTAVSEACINAMEHGNEYDISTKVYVLMTLQPDRLAIDVVDEGRSGPPPAEVKVPDLEAQIEGALPPGGMGLYVIKSLVDEAEFVEPATGKGTQFRMVIHVQPPHEQEQDA
jgi:serine/threonine-protein kinase RsbW